MSRNGAGVYTLPEPAFVSQTPISSTAMNSDLSDIADAITGSLARDGQGGMTAAIKLAQTGFTYGADPNTGMSRPGADTQVITCGGVDVVEVETTGVNVTGTLDATAFTQGGAPILPVGLGPLPWSGLTAPTFWVMATGQSLLRASYPALWAFAQTEIAGGNTLYTNGNGTTTFTVPDLRGRVPAGKDGSAGRLTSTTMTPDGETLGAISSNTSQTITLTTPQIPSHTHVNTLTDPTHSHNTPSGLLSFNGGNTQASGANWNAASNGPLATTSSATGISINNVAAGGGGAHSNVQPTIITNFIIYAGA